VNDHARVVRLVEPRRVEIDRESLSQPARGEVRCRTIVSAISPGTEVAAWRGLPPLRPGPTYPRLVGYCNVAEIEAVGDGVVDHACGDRVLSFTSHRSAFNLAERDILLRLPSDADAGAIACTYLFHLGYNAVLRSGIRPGSRVLVMGLGALGLTSVAAAALAGGLVTTLSDQPRAAAIARSYGARAVWQRVEADGEEALFDVVISTTNGWADWSRALRLARPHATIAVLGFPGRGEELPQLNPLDSQYFYVKQLHIEAVGMSPEREDERGFLRFNERAGLRYLADRIMDDSLNPRALIAGTIPAAEIARAYTQLESTERTGVTFLLEW
jgi:threonine dehydrogenase-like Zn-dependent dehydrogenase